MTAVQIGRDPFARESTMREVVAPVGPKTCWWCGNVRKGGKLFAYSTQTDGGRTHRHDGQFCSKSCHDTYHS